MNNHHNSQSPLSEAEAVFVNLLLNKCEVFKSHESQIAQTVEMGSRPCIELFQMLINAEKNQAFKMSQSLN